MVMRKTAWKEAVARGFRPYCVTAGEDGELCHIIRLCGWRIWYEPELHIRHLIGSNRVEWSYLRALCRRIGSQGVGLDVYQHALRGAPRTTMDFVRKTWLWNLTACLRQLWRERRLVAQSRRESMDGDSRALDVEACLGRWTGLIRLWAVYDLRTWLVWRRFGYSYWAGRKMSHGVAGVFAKGVKEVG